MLKITEIRHVSGGLRGGFPEKQASPGSGRALLFPPIHQQAAGRFVIPFQRIGLTKISVCTKPSCFQFIFGLPACREDVNGDVLETFNGFDLLQYLKSVEPRHVNIEENEVRFQRGLSAREPLNGKFWVGKSKEANLV